MPGTRSSGQMTSGDFLGKWRADTQAPAPSPGHSGYWTLTSQTSSRRQNIVKDYFSTDNRESFFTIHNWYHRKSHFNFMIRNKYRCYSPKSMLKAKSSEFIRTGGVITSPAPTRYWNADSAVQCPVITIKWHVSAFGHFYGFMAFVLRILCLFFSFKDGIAWLCFKGTFRAAYQQFTESHRILSFLTVIKTVLAASFQFFKNNKYVF